MKGFFKSFLGDDLRAQIMTNRTGGGKEENNSLWAFSTLKCFGYLLRAFPLSSDVFPPAAWHLMI